MTAAVRHPGEFRWETRLLAVATLFLTALGVASCLGAGTYLASWHHEAMQQAMAAVAGGVLFLVAARTDYHIWRKVALPLLLLTIVGLVIIAMVAVRWRGAKGPGAVDALVPMVNGAHRWIQLGVRIQVAEIARFTLAVWLAAYAADLGTKVRRFNEGFLPLIGAMAVVAILVAVEPSVTMAASIGIVGLTVIFTAGARMEHVAFAALVGAAAVVLIMKFDPVRASRTKEYQGTTVECGPKSQACQSLIGFGSGGIFGVGFGRGTQKLGHLPEAYSDFLLSVIGEEWGLVGITFVTLCFTAFCWMGLRIARTASDPFGTYLAAGLTVGIGASAILHAAVVTWLMPTTGLTLPFMSIGRVSLVLCLVSAGVIVSIGRQRGRPARE
ncbi:MAG: FtsW/RodA/SpoVE family cell cycle protein [Gemmatimonadales bacterium]